MFLTTSAIIAILIEDEQADALYAKLDTSKRGFFVSPLVRYEAGVILAHRKYEATKSKPKPSPEDFARANAVVAKFLSLLGARDVVINSDIGRLAMEVAQQYGQLVGHKAQLSIGDCFAYACAKSHRLPLLHTGNEFLNADLT